jgi:hypothetical protein
MKKYILIFFLLTGASALSGQEPGTSTLLNGLWDFEQTEDAFPPEKFTRKWTHEFIVFIHLLTTPAS